MENLEANSDGLSRTESLQSQTTSPQLAACSSIVSSTNDVSSNNRLIARQEDCGGGGSDVVSCGANEQACHVVLNQETPKHEVSISFRSKVAVENTKDSRTDNTKRIASSRRIWKSHRTKMEDEKTASRSPPCHPTPSKQPSQGMDSLLSKKEWPSNERHRSQRAPSIERPYPMNNSFISAGVSQGDEMARKRELVAALGGATSSPDFSDMYEEDGDDKAKPKAGQTTSTTPPLPREDSASHRVGAMPVGGRAFGAIPAWARRPPPPQTPSQGASARQQAAGGGRGASSSSVLPSTRSIARANVVDDAEAIVEATNVESELKQRKRRLCITFALVLMVCVALVVTVSIVTRNNNDDSSSDDATSREDQDPCDLNPQDYIGKCLCGEAVNDGIARAEALLYKLRPTLAILNQDRPNMLFHNLSDCDPRVMAFHWLQETLDIMNMKEDFGDYVADDSTAQLLLVQRYILAIFFLSVADDNVTLVRSFLNEALPSCEWTGVECTSFGRVEQLSLTNQGLMGTIPSETGKLSYLRILELGENPGLEGGVPKEILGIRTLRTLDVRGNQFKGRLEALIPLPNQSGLDELLLDRNEYSGTIPSGFGLLSRLRKLYIENNRLRGTIPQELGIMTDLEELKLGSNHLSGAVPPDVASLKYLQQLILRDNHLSGELPTSINQTWGLQVLDFGENDFTGKNRAEDYCRNVSTLDLVFVDCKELNESQSTRCDVEKNGVKGPKCRCICTVDGVGGDDSLSGGYYDLRDGAFVL